MKKLPKKVIVGIEREAARFKKVMETPNPECDRLLNELRKEVQNKPPNMTKEEEIAYILRKSDKQNQEALNIINQANV